MKMTRKKKLGLGAITAVAVLSAALICDSRYNIQLTEYDLSFQKLPAEFEGFKVLHLSDLHGTSFGRDNSRLAELVVEQQPDMIVLTGDMNGANGDLSALEGLLSGIEGAAPIYSVNGNHEWAENCVTDSRKLMESYGVRCLSNDYELFYRGDSSILVVGAEDRNGPRDMISPWELTNRACLEYSDKFFLWLTHRNDYVTMYPDLPCDLVLCGHAHGGIIRLPLVGGLLDVHHKLIAEYESGLYPTEHYVMEVSRGLGNSIPVPRLLNRPELVSITLHSKHS